MLVARHDAICPKCDAVLSAQTDGSIVTSDIAHQGERVHEAMAKLEHLIIEAKLHVTAKLRIIVGSGLIRDEAEARLSNLVFRGDIIKFEQDGHNKGVLMVRIR